MGVICGARGGYRVNTVRKKQGHKILRLVHRDGERAQLGANYLVREGGYGLSRRNEDDVGLSRSPFWSRASPPTSS